MVTVMWLALGMVVGGVGVGGVVTEVAPGGSVIGDGTPTGIGGNPEGIEAAEWLPAAPFDGG